MPKQVAAPFIMSENMWGKPLPATARKVAADKKKQKVTRMQTEDDDIDSDVDAELEEVDEAEVALADEDAVELIGEEAVANTDTPDDEEKADDDANSDPEDSEDAVAESHDEVDANVDADAEKDALNTTSAKNRKVIMSEKKSGADHIRDEIEHRRVAGDSLRGVDVVAALAKRRIDVSPAQVSQLLKKAGLGGKPRNGRSAGAKVKAVESAQHVEDKSRVAAKGRAVPKRPATAVSARPMLPMAQLRAAHLFLNACDGCYKTAEEILSTHKQLGVVYDVSR